MDSTDEGTSHEEVDKGQDDEPKEQRPSNAIRGAGSAIEIGSEDDTEPRIVVFMPYAKFIYRKDR